MRGYFVVEGVCILQLEQFLAEEVDFLFLLVELELLFSEWIPDSNQLVNDWIPGRD